ncbi:MAG: iron-containing alcohol dehydrogenase [bacterium]
MKLRAYQFFTPTQIIFGWQSIRKLPQIIFGYGKKVLLVTGHTAARKAGILTGVQKLLEEKKIDVTIFDNVEPEPSCDTVNSAVALAKARDCDVVIGLGGGSALDVAKAIAGIFNTGLPVEEFHSGAKHLLQPGLPLIAIPTTSGTGSEVTPNCVLIDSRKKIKKSFRSDHLFARVAIVDPELTLGLPPQQTAYSGMDALCQSIESFVSKDANPLTDAIALQSIRLVKNNLMQAYTNEHDKDARIAMSYAALFSGIALTNAKMGAVHGIVPQLGTYYNVSHGLLCGLLLPAVMEFNVDIAGAKYAHIAAIFGQNVKEMHNIDAGRKAIESIKKFLADLQFPAGLKALGIQEKNFSKIAKESMPSGSLKANPKRVTEQNVIDILRNCL